MTFIFTRWSCILNFIEDQYFAKYVFFQKSDNRESNFTYGADKIWYFMLHALSI